MKKRKICVVTGTRAEYGLLRWLMDGINQSSKLELQVIATGMHLSPEFGLTYKEIENDGFKINYKVRMPIKHSVSKNIVRATALGMIGFSKAFNKLKPDLVVVLGDRFEILSAAFAAHSLQRAKHREIWPQRACRAVTCTTKTEGDG